MRRILFVCAAALLAPVSVFPVQAQEQPPAAPEAPQASGAVTQAGNAPLPPMPPPDPANFTAASPTKETVNEFLKQSWGYDANRLWQVQAIQTTPVQGLSRVVVLVEEKGSGQQAPSSLSFFVLPDQRHLISDDVLPFGARPFDGYRDLLRKEANGPSQGASARELQFTEFADFQCPHCKEAQPIVERLLKDFPNAHFVYENFPLMQIHSEALKASEYGVCVAKLGGDAAFFKFASAVYANQGALTPDLSTETLKNAATSAGQDAAKVAACAATPEAKAAVEAQLRLGESVGVNSTPTLFVNGRGLPFGGIPYDTLKQIIEYQEKIDGVPGAGK